MYILYDFAMNPDTSKSKFIDDYKIEIESKLQTLYNRFVKNKYYVVISEMGACDKKNDYDRIFWANFFVSKARHLFIVVLYGINISIIIMEILKKNWDYSVEIKEPLLLIIMFLH